ncbi:MAG: hypothetical protein ACYC1Q_07525 [Bacteroidia bacterium]
MKKLTLTLLLMLPLLAAAQEFRVGTFHSLNNASVTDQQLFHNKVRRPGYMGDFHISITSKKLEYGLGVSYTQRGFAFLVSMWKDTSATEKVSKFVYYQYDYLSLPLSIHYRGDNRFFGQFGLSLIPAYLVGHRVYLEEERQDNIASGPSKFDLGAQLNLGCGLKLNATWSILTRLSFYQSITRLNNDTYFPNDNFRNKATSLGIGIEYRFKG